MSKGLLFGLIAAAIITSAVVFIQKEQQKDQFQIWKSRFPVTWGPEEQVYRKIIFLANVAKINRHNADSTKTYQMGINQFTPFTDAQFALTYLTPKPYNPEWQSVDVQMTPNGESIDWTQKGAVSPVKNQGNCGSCWAFSAVATLESFSLMNRKQSVDLSEQQLVDCGKGTHGCNGGFNYLGLNYVQSHGIATTAQYPYVAKTQNCRKDGGNFKISTVNSTNGCANIRSAVQLRPIGVSVDATNWSSYRSGVFNNCKAHLNHDVTLVGANDNEWKIKNSWSTSWGENGFIRLATGNTCGICQDKSPWPL